MGPKSRKPNVQRTEQSRTAPVHDAASRKRTCTGTKSNKTQSPGDLRLQLSRSEQSRSTSNSSKINSSGSPSSSSVKPLMSLHITSPILGRSCPTDVKLASKSQHKSHKKHKKGSKLQDTDTSLAKADADLELECAEVEKNYGNVTGDNAEKLADSPVQPSSVKEKDQLKDELKHESEEKHSECKDKVEGFQLVDEKISENSAEPQTSTEVASGTDSIMTAHQLPETSAKNTDAELPQSDECISHCDDGTRALHVEMKPVQEEDGSNNDIVSSAASVSCSPVNSAPCKEKSDCSKMPNADVHTERNKPHDNKHTEQPEPQSNREVKNRDRRSKHSVLAVCERKRSRERSDHETLRSDDRQHSVYRRRECYKQDVSYSWHDSKHDSNKRQKHDSAEKHYYYDHVYNQPPRVQDCSREYLQRFDIRCVLPDLEDISSDEDYIEYRYEDCGSHCCRFCHVMFETLPSLLEHLQSASHEQVFHFVNKYLNISSNCYHTYR